MTAKQVRREVENVRVRLQKFLGEGNTSGIESRVAGEVFDVIDQIELLNNSASPTEEVERKVLLMKGKINVLEGMRLTDHSPI